MSTRIRWAPAPARVPRRGARRMPEPWLQPCYGGRFPGVTGMRLSLSERAWAPEQGVTMSMKTSKTCGGDVRVARLRPRARRVLAGLAAAAAAGLALLAT